MNLQPAGAGVCDFCGLPLPRAWFVSRTEEESPGPRFCCFGCRFAAGVMKERGEPATVSWSLMRLGLSIFFTMNVMVFTMALWSRDIYAAAGADRLSDSFAEVFRYLGLVFALPVLLLLGGPILDEAWTGLKRRVITTDLLIVAGVAAAYAVSVVAVLRGGEHVYFEVGCVVLVFVSLGRWLEATAKMKTVAAIDALERLLPAQARLVGTDGESLVDLHELKPGNIVRVLPGERFPADGTLRCREATIDEQLFTGESWPVTRGCGDAILGGTLNIDGPVDVNVAVSPAEGTFARLVSAVRRARDTRTRYETLADSVTSWFVPSVALIALATLAVHWSHRGFEPAVMSALSVVLIACPCALGLATPLAVWCAIGRATREQVLFRNGDAIERLASVHAIRFDKTGTLTSGRPRVARFVCDDETKREAVQGIAAAVAARSDHAFARAVVESASHRSRPIAFSEVEQRPGRGLSAVSTDGGTTVLLGNRRLVEEAGWTVSESLNRAADLATRAGQPLSFVGWNGTVRGLFVFQESLRPEAAQAVEWFSNAGYDVGVLTGDHRERGAQLSRELGVPVEAGLLPEEKGETIRRLRERSGPVAFVGDGVNDAPALIASDAGIAMGCGTDITRETADICLLGNDLAKLPWLIELSRASCRAIRWNLVWAFGYNGLGIALAACGLLNPGFAALLMTASSFFVIVNSLRLQHFPAENRRGQNALGPSAALSSV